MSEDGPRLSTLISVPVKAWDLNSPAARALLSKVDWQSRGLEGFGRPDNFHERQVDRWLAFLERIKCRELPGLDIAAEWLRNHRPRHWSPGIMHGDYQFANVMFSHGAPAELAAIIDWEMTTVGDPLLDLGWVMMSWPTADGDIDGNSVSSSLSMDGMPSRDEMLDHYETISGRSTSDIDYYIILARFKLGIVLEQGYKPFPCRRGSEPEGRGVRPARAGPDQ